MRITKHLSIGLPGWGPVQVVAISLLVTLLTACGGGGGDGEDPAPPLPPLVTPGQWVVLGSSTAQGASATKMNGWAQQLAEEMLASGVRTSNLAKGGSTTYAALPTESTPPVGRPAPNESGNVTAALALTPQLIFLSYPSNDTALGYSAEETVDNLRRVRQLALDRGVPVVILGTQPRAMADALLDRQAEIDRQLALLAGECFVEVRSGLAGPDGRLAAEFNVGDGIHPNNAGHAVILARVRARLRSARCVRLAS